MKRSKTDKELEYTTEKRVVYKTVKKKKFRLKLPTIFITLILIVLIIEGVIKFLNMPVSNIYISGNTLYSDWDIIKKANLDNYPALIQYSKSGIVKKLEKDDLIKKVKVTRKRFTRIYIYITENKPLFYDNNKEKTILSDGTKYDGRFDLPVLVNEMPASIYNDLIKEISKIDESVLIKISEIKYDPDDVDEERILLTMTDGNYVYITMLKFDMLNNYNDIVKTFDNKKGILYLNSGEYFKILEK